MERIVELKNVFDECVNYMSSYGSIKPPMPFCRPTAFGEQDCARYAV